MIKDQYPWSRKLVLLAFERLDGEKLAQSRTNIPIFGN